MVKQLYWLGKCLCQTSTEINGSIAFTSNVKGLHLFTINWLIMKMKLYLRCWNASSYLWSFLHWSFLLEVFNWVWPERSEDGSSFILLLQQVSISSTFVHVFLYESAFFTRKSCQNVTFVRKMHVKNVDEIDDRNV